MKKEKKEVNDWIDNRDDIDTENCKKRNKDFIPPFYSGYCNYPLYETSTWTPIGSPLSSSKDIKGIKVSKDSKPVETKNKPTLFEFLDEYSYNYHNNFFGSSKPCFKPKSCFDSYYELDNTQLYGRIYKIGTHKSHEESLIVNYDLYQNIIDKINNDEEYKKMLINSVEELIEKKKKSKNFKEPKSEFYDINFLLNKLIKNL